MRFTDASRISCVGAARARSGRDFARFAFEQRRGFRRVGSRNRATRCVSRKHACNRHAIGFFFSTGANRPSVSITKSFFAKRVLQHPPLRFRSISAPEIAESKRLSTDSSSNVSRANFTSAVPVSEEPPADRERGVVDASSLNLDATLWRAA